MEQDDLDKLHVDPLYVVTAHVGGIGFDVFGPFTFERATAFAHARPNRELRPLWSPPRGRINAD